MLKTERVHLKRSESFEMIIATMVITDSVAVLSRQWYKEVFCSDEEKKWALKEIIFFFLDPGKAEFWSYKLQNFKLYIR